MFLFYQHDFYVVNRSRQFEAEQAELLKKLAALQNELAVLKQLYHSLLEQVGQQHSVIQELSELQGTQNSGEDISYTEANETGGECNQNTGSGLIYLICCKLFVTYPQQEQQNRLMLRQQWIQILIFFKIRSS